MREYCPDEKKSVDQYNIKEMIVFWSAFLINQYLFWPRPRFFAESSCSGWSNTLCQPSASCLGNIPFLNMAFFFCSVSSMFFIRVLEKMGINLNCLKNSFSVSQSYSQIDMCEWLTQCPNRLRGCQQAFDLRAALRSSCFYTSSPSPQPWTGFRPQVT